METQAEYEKEPELGMWKWNWDWKSGWKWGSRGIKGPVRGPKNNETANANRIVTDFF